MFKNILAGTALGVTLAASGMAAAAEPEILTSTQLDSVSAGYGFTYPAMVPTAAAFAYAFTTASDTPGIRVIIDVSYSGGTGLNQSGYSGFAQSIKLSY